MGIDRSTYSAALQAKIVFAGANNTSYAQAEQDLRVLAELEVSDKQVRRLCQVIGAERVAERDAEVAAYQGLPLVQRKQAPAGVSAPEVAVVGVDGGRLQIFERSGAAATEPEVIEDDVLVVAAAAEKAGKKSYWREDKIGLLLTLTSVAQAVDPCPEIPESFVDPSWIAELTKEMKGRGASKREAEKTTTDPPGPKPLGSRAAETKWKPEVQGKHLVGTRRPWAEFGPMVATQAWSLGFFAAGRRAFVGDGAENNWALWRTYFSSFVPILDFIHALTYVFQAAQAGRTLPAAWLVYERWIRWVWAGEVEQVIVELAQRQAELGVPAADAKATDPAKVVAAALTYLQRHKDQMRYAEYRRQGLPIVSSYVESAVKQYNYRVKGTEKFWRELGAEPLLQLRGDYLSDGEVMPAFWQRRQARESGQARYRRAE